MTHRVSSQRSHGWCRDDFEVESLLGEGALSRVYLARNVHTNQKVAVKVIPKHRIPSSAILQSIVSERNVLCSLGSHPHVIHLYCTFQDEGYLYFVLNYVSGGSLHDTVIRYGRRIPESLIMYWICDIVNMLSYLRVKNVVHRDIKMDNLMVDSDRRLCLIDFNSATVVKSSGDPSETYNLEYETYAKAPFGTLPNLAPEVLLHVCPKLFRGDPSFETWFSTWLRHQRMLVQQFMQSASSPYASDIWSAGCVVYELLCGRHPFKGATPLETVFNILDCRLIIPPGLGELEVDLLRSMLAVIPEDRIGLNDMNELRMHPVFAGLDPDIAMEGLPRPDYCPVVDPGAETVDDVDMYEFTPDLGCSFGGVPALENHDALTIPPVTNNRAVQYMIRPISSTIRTPSTSDTTSGRFCHDAMTKSQIDSPSNVSCSLSSVSTPLQHCLSPPDEPEALSLGDSTYDKDIVVVPPPEQTNQQSRCSTLLPRRDDGQQQRSQERLSLTTYEEPLQTYSLSASPSVRSSSNPVYLRRNTTLQTSLCSTPHHGSFASESEQIQIPLSTRFLCKNGCLTSALIGSRVLRQLTKRQRAYTDVDLSSTSTSLQRFSDPTAAPVEHSRSPQPPSPSSQHLSASTIFAAFNSCFRHYTRRRASSNESTQSYSSISTAAALDPLWRRVVWHGPAIVLCVGGSNY